LPQAEDWTRFAASALIDSGVIEIGDGYRAKLDELGSDGLPFARAAQIDGGFELGSECLRTEFLLRAGPKVSRAGDVVLTTKGTVGRIAWVRRDTPRFVYSPQLSYWRSLQPEVLNSRFLYYWMHGTEFRAQIAAVEGQTDMAAYVSLRDQRRMTLAIPSPDTQQRICALLGALDDKIDLNRRTSATLEELARAMFASWFGVLDPERAPDGWTIASMGQHVEVTRGLSYNSAGLSDDGVPLHNLDSIADTGGYRYGGIKHYRGEYRPRHVARTGDLLVVNTDLTWAFQRIAQPALVPERFGDLSLFSADLFRLRPTAESYLTTRFLYLALMSIRLRQLIVGYSNGTTVNHLAADGLQRPRLAVPPADLVQRFDRMVAPLFAKKEQLQLESETLAQMRDILLPKLMSGEIWLKEADKAVAEAP
jgi:type I restriction enzyme, S subunit